MQNSISLLCESWWKGRLLERETLLPNTIIYLIGQSLSTSKVGREGGRERVGRYVHVYVSV